jgi:hypothetical protein
VSATEFDAEALKAWLIGRDVRLRPPATPTVLADLQAAFRTPIHPDVIRLYSTFDGCEDYDFDAEYSFSIWPISMGLEFAKERGLSDVLPFADAEFSCDVALCSVMEPTAPVRWWGEMLPENRSLVDFFDTIRTGRLWGRR